jgi:hypothetical protein
MKFGFNITRIETDDWTTPNDLFGNLTFSNRYTGFPYADFLLGIPTTAQRAFPNVRLDALRKQYDFFFTDDFKVTPRLTLNYGIRYEYHPLWTEEHGLRPGGGRLRRCQDVSHGTPHGVVGCQFTAVTS